MYFHLIHTNRASIKELSVRFRLVIVDIAFRSKASFRLAEAVDGGEAAASLYRAKLDFLCTAEHSMLHCAALQQ